jgi:hypothetical protein
MTFAIVLANADHIVQASDRRLTNKNGTLNNDSANKAGHAICDDASFLYCFTGLASIGNGSEDITSNWLMETLYDAAQHGHRYRDIVDAFADEASKFFSSSRYVQRLAAADRRLTVMLTGHTADDFIFNALISNFQDHATLTAYPEAREQFMVHAEQSPDFAQNPAFIRAIGQSQALTDADRSRLREMLASRRPAEAMVQKAIALIQDIADRPQTCGTVGKGVNTARLSRADPLVSVGAYASGQLENTIHLLDKVNLRTGAPRVFVSDFRVSTASPVVFPRVHRNAPCPCKSGKRYRHCHRR